MTTKYLIALWKGEYEAKYEISDSPAMMAEKVCEAVGATIVYRGNLLNPKGIKIIEDFMKETNEIGKFDPKALENRLKKE